jgi:glutaredoxin
MTNDSEIIFYHTTWCPDCVRAKRFLVKHKIACRWINVSKDVDGLAYVKEVNNGIRVVPTIVFPDGEILTEPSNAELAEKLDLDK